MFDDQHTEQDLMFRSILENGQEEVPARVWDGVASGLDKIARRRKVALWWSGAAVSTAAAAAIAVGVVLNRPAEDFVLPAQEDMVAVVAVPAGASEGTSATVAEAAQQTTYLAYAPAAPKEAPVGGTSTDAVSNGMKQEISAGPAAPEASADPDVPDAPATPAAQKKTTKSAASENTSSAGFDEWAEEQTTQRRKVKTSLVLSSTTGANGASKTSAAGRLRRPVNPNSLIKTGITEIGNNRYGLPFSAGIGVRIDLTDKWSVGVGVNYTLLTRKFEGDYLKVEEGSILEYTQSDIRNLQHYIGIPVNAYYNIISKDWINFYTYAGGAVEKCVMNKFQILESKSVHKEKVQGVQWSANLGIGVEFMLGKHVGLYIDPSARYYFNCGQPKSIRTTQPFMIGVELGLRTRF